MADHIYYTFVYEITSSAQGGFIDINSATRDSRGRGGGQRRCRRGPSHRQGAGCLRV